MSERDQPQLEALSVMDLQRWLEDQAKWHEMSHPSPLASAALRWVGTQLEEAGVRWALLGDLPQRRALGDKVIPPPLGGSGFPPT